MRMNDASSSRADIAFIPGGFDSLSGHDPDRPKFAHKFLKKAIYAESMRTRQTIEHPSVDRDR
jgi:hypothetical protein